MLKFECSECGNTTAVIKKDSEGDLVSECLACEEIDMIDDNDSISIHIV